MNANRTPDYNRWPFVADDPSMPHLSNLSKLSKLTPQDRSVPAKSPARKLPVRKSAVLKTVRAQPRVGQAARTPSAAATPLSLKLLKAWIVDHAAKKGQAPSVSTKERAPDGSTWASINTSISNGGRSWDAEPQSLSTLVKAHFPKLVKRA